jgi:hypothetical protein
VSSLQRKPSGFVAVGAFLFFGAMMAGLAATRSAGMTDEIS